MVARFYKTFSERVVDIVPIKEFLSEFGAFGFSGFGRNINFLTKEKLTKEQIQEIEKYGILQVDDTVFSTFPAYQFLLDKETEDVTTEA